jgi:branched-chain amino acid transport system substrate-binding protein
MALTGGVAGIGKQVLAALQIWTEDVNAKGGLLGRPVKLIFYDDQSNPSNIPPIYTKLIDVDKVDLLIGPYATNMVAPAIPVVMAHNMTTIGILANAANSQFHYKRYFSMLTSGPEPQKSFSTGFFDLAMQHQADLKTVAIVGADAEFSQNAITGARENLKGLPFTTVFDRSYPPQTTDFAPIMRAIQATNPDIIYAAAYPPDTVGLLRAANEVGVTPKLFGGTFIGLIITAVKMQLGPLTNGIVNNEAFLPVKSLDFPGLKEMLAKYQAIAAKQGIDPLGYGTPPFGYAAGQVLAQAVEATKGLDQDKIATYIHSHSFSTVIGELSFGPDGEWSKSRSFFVQFQHVTGNGLEQFRDLSREVVVWPDTIKTGNLTYPYTAAKQP